jgi:hypothetical protein
MHTIYTQHNKFQHTHICYETHNIRVRDVADILMPGRTRLIDRLSSAQKYKQL